LDQLSANINGLCVVTISPTVNLTVYGLPPLNNQTYSSSFCNTTANDVQHISDEITDKANPLFSSMNQTTQSVRQTLVNVQSQIISSASQASQEIQSARTEIQSARNDVSQYSSKVKYYDNIRRPVVILFLCLPLISGVLLLLGGCLRKSAPFSINYVLTFVVLFLFWMLFAIHLPLAVITGDSCVYLDQVEVDLPNRLGEQEAKVFDACLLNTSLVQVYNLSSDLNFVNEIHFPPLPNINEAFNFTQFNAYFASGIALNTSSFGFNDSQIDANIATINSLTESYNDPNAPYNRSTLQNLNNTFAFYHPSTFQQVIEKKKYETLQLITAEARINESLTSIKNQIIAIKVYSDELEANTTNIMATVGTIQSTVNPLLNYAQTVFNLAYCGFIGTAYASFKSDFCDGIVTAISLLALAFLMVAAMGVPIVILSIVLMKRLPKVPDDNSRTDGEGEDFQLETKKGKGKDK